MGWLQRALAWVVALLGLLCLVAGLALVVVLGPDSRFSTGPHAIDTNGVAVVTAPGVITWKGVRTDVLVEVPVNKPVFIGLGNSVDVQSYLSRVQRLEVTDYRTPWSIETRERRGQPALPGAPTALDWWIDDAAGLGGARISTTLPDETVSLAVLAVGSNNLSGLQVSVAYGLDGGFAKGIGLALVGLAGMAAGFELRRRRLANVSAVLTAPVVVVEPEPVTSAPDRAPEEEYVYLYVDEHGVEREVTAEEAERLAASEGVPVVETDESTDVVVEVLPEPEAGPGPEPDPDSDPDPESESESPRFVTESVTVEPEMTHSVTNRRDQSADVAGDGDGGADDVVYVWVDDDGVEHEISADELDDFEPLDDPDDRSEERR